MILKRMLSGIMAAAITITPMTVSAEGILNEDNIPLTMCESFDGLVSGVGTITAEAVNLRENPNLDTDVLRTLHQDDKAIVIQKAGKWYEVIYDQQIGFVHKDYISVKDKDTVPDEFAMTVADVNVRQEPNDKCEIITTVSEDMPVLVTGVDGQWYSVRVDGEEGYVRSDLLDIIKDVPDQYIYDFAVVQCQVGNMRSAPSQEADVIDMLYMDSRADLVGDDGEWYQISYAGQIGYMAKRLLSPSNDPYEGSDPLATANQVAAERAAEEALAAEMAQEATLNRNIEPPAPVAQDEKIAEESDNDYITEDDDIYDYTERPDNETGYEEYTPYDEEDEQTWVNEAYIDDAEPEPYDINYDEPSDILEYPDNENEEPSFDAPDYDESAYEETVYEESDTSGYGDGIVSTAMAFVGCPYVWGGTSPSGFDCSGFVQYVFMQNGYYISRLADTQYYDGYVVSYDNLQPGDLVFFENTYAEYGITHVGIYIGGGAFVHAANSNDGVKVSYLSEGYYASRYYGACRIAE